MVRWRALVWLGVLLWPNMAKAEYLQVLKYVGMHCSRVQKDSLAHPRNEVFINTIVQDMGSGRAFDRKLPTGRPFYRNVSAGFTARGPVTTLWSGRAAGLRLLVAMWEHDGGGGSVDEFSYALVAAAKVYFIVQSGGAAAAGRGVRGAAAMAARGPKPGQASPEPGAIDRFFARNMRTVLGANHDLLGHASVRIDGGDWHAAPLRSAFGIRYHFRTAHRRAGADCQAYFRFDRGQRVAVAPPDRPLPRRADEPQRGPPPHRGFEPPGRPPPPREGDLYARNRCVRSIDIAWSYRDRGGRWHTVGWSSIDPGATRAVLRRPSNRVLYLHAADGARPAAHDGARHRRRLAVVDAAFDHVDGQAASSPGWRRELFHQFTMPANGDDLVVAFDCPAGVYQVRAHNRCNRTIHVAMHYRARDGRGRTEGYSPLEPGEIRNLEIQIGEPQVAFYAGVAQPEGGNGQQSSHEVISRGFTHVQGTVLSGPNKRRVRFTHVTLPTDRVVSTVGFSCPRR